MLDQIKGYFGRTQEYMKLSVDKHMRDFEFIVGAPSFLKLRSYMQQSAAHIIYQKLAAKFYCLYEVVEWIGKTTYRLKLPPDSKIHLGFHVSQLRVAQGQDIHSGVFAMLWTSFFDVGELVPEHIFDTRYNSKHFLDFKFRG